MSLRGRRFSSAVVTRLQTERFMWIRAGAEHRFIGIWTVVVGGQVFVRSWGVRANGWYRTFRALPHGAIRIGEREIPIRTVRVRSERLNDAVDRAYLEKYTTRASVQYARGLGTAKRRETTTELQPR